jgi:hypothetical protein
MPGIEIMYHLNDYGTQIQFDQFPAKHSAFVTLNIQTSEGTWDNPPSKIQFFAAKSEQLTELIKVATEARAWLRQEEERHNTDNG